MPKTLPKKKCAYCQDEFTPNTARSKYCQVPHPMKCTICGSNMIAEVTPSRSTYTCSTKCRVEASKKTSMEKYGVDNPAKSKEVIQKIKDVNMERYGVTSIFKDTEAVKKAVKAKYGVDNPMKVQAIKDKMKEKHREKHGVDYPMQRPDVQETLSKSMTEKYGVPNRNFLNVNHLEDWENFPDFVKNGEVKTVYALAEYFNVSDHSVRRKIREHKLQKWVKIGVSRKEEILCNMLDSLGVSYIRNDRKILEGKEIDVLIPDFKLGIEVSPTYTHNSTVGWGGDPETAKPKDYHINKFKKAEEKGIDLITIFDWHDWDKAMEMVRHRVSTSQRTPARKTKAVFVKGNNPILKEFVQEWHLLGMASNQGGVLGYTFLVDSSAEPVKEKAITNNHILDKKDVDTLKESILGVTLWTSYSQKDLSNPIELKRMVFRPGYSVAGGASKMLKSMVAHYELFLGFTPSDIVTFSDKDLGRGSVYQKIGFSLIEDSRPQVNYHNLLIGDPLTGAHIKHRSLVLQGADRLLRNLIDGYEEIGIGPDKPSNRDIVMSYGFTEIHDCGYRKWVLKLS